MLRKRSYISIEVQRMSNPNEKDLDKLDDLNEEKERSMYLVAYIGGAVVLALVILVGICVFNWKKDDTPVKATQQTVNENIAAEIDTQSSVDKQVDAKSSNENIDNIMKNAVLGIETFTYTAYCQLDTLWNEELSDKDLAQLQSMGGDESTLTGISILGLVGNITPTKECLTVLSQRSMMADIESRSTQTFFDFKTKKSYSQTNNLVTQESTDWVTSDITSDIILFENFFTNLDLTEIKEDDNNYYISGTYKYNAEDDSNNMNWVLYYILSSYNLTLKQDIPVSIIINKTNLQIQEMVLDLNELIDTEIGAGYKITNVQFKVTFKDINTTEVVIPEELQNKIK